MANVNTVIPGYPDRPIHGVTGEIDDGEKTYCGKTIQPHWHLTPDDISCLSCERVMKAWDR